MGEDFFFNLDIHVVQWGKIRKKCNLGKPHWTKYSTIFKLFSEWSGVRRDQQSEEKVFKNIDFNLF